MFRYLVLGLMRPGEPRHGYALMKEYRDRSGHTLSTGNFYRELQRLEQGGLVRTVPRSEEEDPRRAPNRITEAGEHHFDGWLRTPTRELAGCCDDELSTRALFLGLVDRDEAERIIAAWKDDLWSIGKNLERSREATLAASLRRDDPNAATLATLLARRLKHVAADLEFLEELRAGLARTERTPPVKSSPASQGRRSATRGAAKAVTQGACAESEEAYAQTRKQARRRAP